MQTVSQIMQAFALRTGVIGHESAKRYLWTDAFAVCNFLGLYEVQKKDQYLDLAHKLVDQVHLTLGHYKEDNAQKGWISTLSEHEGTLHPTVGGLRIGKSLPQRGKDEPFDEALEWERDGQYFHYLTKWMHALSRMTQVTGEYRYNRWAIELAKTAFAKFSYIDPQSGQRRMYWKMSTDLSRPLVSSMGQHDALDGLVTFLELQAVAKSDHDLSKSLNLSFEIEECTNISSMTNLTTADPLGIGGLLSDTYLLWKVQEQKEPFYFQMLQASVESLREYVDSENINYPAEYRLAFRELGLAIGLKAIQKMDKSVSNSFSYYIPFADELITFWAKEKNQQNRTWQDHADINSVMLATALAPDGYLG